MTAEETCSFAHEIRQLTCEMLAARGDGHIGGSLSIADALAVLFGGRLRQDENLAPQDRDWFVLSKGHAGPAYYATLILTGRLGREHVDTLNSDGTLLPSHPDRNRTPGVEVTTGSLGQGISQAVGLAWAIQAQGGEGRVYCIVGDGEFEEGQVYEAVQFAGGKRLDNFYLMLDHNGKQVDGLVSRVACDLDFRAILSACGFATHEVDGNSVKELTSAFELCDSERGLAHAVIMNTIKGKGIPYFETQKNPHHVTFTSEELEVLRSYAMCEEKGKVMV